MSDQEFAASTDLSKVSGPASLDSVPDQPATVELRMPSREIGEIRELAKA